MFLLTILFLALLFLGGLLATVFHASLVQYFFSKKPIKASPSSSPPSPETPKKKKKKTSNNGDQRSKKKEELRRVFATFDKNGDGFITRQELKESLRNIRIVMSDKEINEIVVKFDSNGDGLIDFDEFCLLTDECMGREYQRGSEEDEDEDEGELREEEEENLKEAFGVFDKDKDGRISVEELALVLTSLGLREGKKMEDCKEMIRKVDMDGDGMVDFHEFKTMMKSRKLVLAS
ncbi:calmodulin-like protein 7 [Prosopis cineraria]|uniref:calmodulin-like protein 7 n=1 Tax=Prosopis cineraria TaxID=364024 RepID=UPI00240F1140|nr:calmodulin-like protein 7 [Prosopis cineraria]